MTEPQMDPTKATALRRPFPKQSIGILPKPYKKDSPKGQCNECGGYHGLPAVHLDYVGHAAVTDRLLTVDPGWSWEPMALDQFGSPQCDRDGNLWIRLTVCGVSRIGVGDGLSMKERIGDAIRNAAMRFGVALDLWAKENLVEFAQAAQTPDQPPVAPPDPDHVIAYDTGGHPIDTSGPMQPKTRARMFALFGKQGIEDRAEQIRGISHIITRPITSRGSLTENEAKRVIAKLEEREKARPALPDPSTTEAMESNGTMADIRRAQ